MTALVLMSAPRDCEAVATAHCPQRLVQRTVGDMWRAVRLPAHIGPGQGPSKGRLIFTARCARPSQVPWLIFDSHAQSDSAIEASVHEQRDEDDDRDRDADEPEQQ
jgi:hypothetical protein